jgi:hypothetical protein
MVRRALGALGATVVLLGAACSASSGSGGGAVADHGPDARRADVFLTEDEVGMPPDEDSVALEVGGRSSELHDRQDALAVWRAASDLEVTVTDGDGRERKLAGDPAAEVAVDMLWGGGSAAPCAHAHPVIDRLGARWFHEGDAWLVQWVAEYADEDAARSAVEGSAEEEARIDYSADHTVYDGASCGSPTPSGTPCDAGDECLVYDEEDGYIGGHVRVGAWVVVLSGQRTGALGIDLADLLEKAAARVA